MTVSETDQGHALDPVASQRAELLGRLIGAQIEQEAIIRDLTASGGDPSAIAQSVNQLQSLAQLQRSASNASPTALASLRTEIMAAIASASASAQQARAASGTGQRADDAGLASLSASSRDQVQALMADMHRFDAALNFASPADEADYRQREAERRADIEEQHRKDTREGNLNAAGAAAGQMVDAAAHGAGGSPEFQQRWDELAATTEKLRAEIIRKGGSTKEFDERLRNDFRVILRSKGLSEADIAGRLAAHPDNPLEAMKAYVANEKDLANLMQSVETAVSHSAPAQITAVTASANSFAATDPMAEFRAAGIALADHAPDAPFAHGVALNDAPQRPGGRGVNS